MSSFQQLFSYFGGTTYDQFRFDSDDTLQLTLNNGNSANAKTSAVFRDPSAWYHIVALCDTTNATANDRLQLWVNGVRQSLGTNTQPTQNYDTYVNTTNAFNIGRLGSGGSHFDGYLTDVNFIDGQALTPSSFGQIESTTGVWSPKQYAGSYGTNGFYLKFGNTSSVAALGTDSSGNGNTWTVNNVSLTAGVTYDSMLDVPVNYSDGGNGRGNYCTLNPLDQIGITCSAGNLNFSSGLSGDYGVRGSVFNSSGKWYFEWEQSTTPQVGQVIGVANASQVLNQSNQHVVSTNLWGFNSGDGQKCNGGQSAYGTAVAANVVVGVAVDMDAGKIYFRNAAGYFNSGDPVAGTNAAFTNLAGQTVAPYYYDGSSGSSPTGSINFGQRPFAYTPPTGFRALNTNNLPTPSIVNGANFMAATTYTGNAAARSLSNAVNNVSFQPDLVWIKSRTPGATSHALFDSVRGAQKYLSSDTTAAETTNANTLTAFGADGFSLGTDTTLVNASANLYVAWQWRESVTAGLDVVTYAGTGVNRTVAHNLGVAPAMVIVKRSQTGATSNWQVRHTSIAAANSIQLNSPNQAAAAATVWNSTAPTSSVFSLGTSTDVNASGISYVAYCFAEIAGFSKIGSYTGNGLPDGPFVFCGFRPRFVMIRRTDAANSWVILDTSRNTSNFADSILWADLANTETPGTATTSIDFVSNGFKLRGSGASVNASGTYIFAAFAEVPSKYALAR